MAECGKFVSGGMLSYPCTLESGHEGPCYAVESTRSATLRKKWEQENG